MSNEVTISQMNEAIARFMELEERHEEYRRPNPTLVFKVGEYYIPVKKLKYHTSWDWIMPVVEKIRGMGYHIEITISVDCSVEIIKLRGDPERDVLRIIAYSTPINAVYTAVYQFITWYNDNQQKQTNEQSTK